jgi:hypothetical protein
MMVGTSDLRAKLSSANTRSIPHCPARKSRGAQLLRTDEGAGLD